MSWCADWFVTCDKCQTQEWMDGKNFEVAKSTARKAGWSVSATKALCPKCRPIKYALDGRNGAALKVDSAPVVLSAGRSGSRRRQ